MAKPKILVFGNLNDEGYGILKDEGFEVITVPDEDSERIYRELADSDGAVASNSHFFGDEVLDNCPRLKIMGRLGVGYDNIDIDSATRHGVQVVNTPTAIIEPVAEHTVMFMLALTRKLVLGDRNVRHDHIFRTPYNKPGAELLGKTHGLVGFGNTGQRTAEITRFGFNMNILYHDMKTYPEAEQKLGAEQRDLETLLSESDFVTVHINMSESTKNLFNEKAFRAMKPTAFFINVSRGGVVDENALVKALREKWILGAGLDVFAEEPPPREHPMWEMDNVVLSPHRAGGSNESFIGCSMVVKDIIRVLKGEAPEFPVNRLP